MGFGVILVSLYFVLKQKLRKQSKSEKASGLSKVTQLMILL